MKTSLITIKGGILTFAVQCALSSNVRADDIDELTHPTNAINFGALFTSQDSARFGQYNGLEGKGFYGLGGFDIRGGDGYNSEDSSLRWRLNGSNLGTTSRTLGGSISEQGHWKLNLDYDELRHNITDTFQTPLQGKMGGNTFTLPDDFGTVNAANGQDSARALTPNQLNVFHFEKEYITRRNGSLSTAYHFTDRLSAQVDFNHIEQSGAKLIGTGSQGGIGLVGGSTGRAEAVNIIMNPTQYSTDNITVSLNWAGDNAHLSGGYYGSLFRNNFNSLSWQSAQTSGASACSGTDCYVNNTMSTAPTNSLHQANLSGGYNFSSATKLTGGFSYGYNSQNDSFAPTSLMQANGVAYEMMQANGLPAASLNGHVETTHGDLKLTNQSIKDLTLTASFKYNERNNSTNSDIYLYNHIGNHAYTGINTPYSHKKVQYEAAADYRLTRSQHMRLTYEREDIKRWCEGVFGNAQCVASPSSDEDKVSLSYRLTAFEDIHYNASYSYAKRNANFDHNYQANTGNYYAANELNSQNKLGYVAYPYANRNRHLIKTGLNWQLSRKWDLSLNGRYAYDDYDVSLGVQNGRSASINADATYNYRYDSSVSAYWSWQNDNRKLLGGNNGTQTIAPTNIWSNQLENNGHSIGLLTRNGGLLNGKLEILGDLSYSLDTSVYSTQVPYLATCASPTSLTCGNLPNIKNELLSFKVTGNYQVHKNGKVSLAYIYQKLNSNDYFYNGQQFGYTPNRVMPTGLQQQDYTVNVIALSYSLAF